MSENEIKWEDDLPTLFHGYRRRRGKIVLPSSHLMYRKSLGMLKEDIKETISMNGMFPMGVKELGNGSSRLRWTTTTNST